MDAEKATKNEEIETEEIKEPTKTAGRGRKRAANDELEVKEKNDEMETEEMKEPTKTAGRGRKRAANDELEVKEKTKRLKISHPSHATTSGVVLVVGEGDVGQLGFGEDVLDRSRPCKVNLPDECIQVVAGGMHTVCLTAKGEVYSFGCNDEGALGRDTTEEGSETWPAKVEMSEKIVQLSAGDSHTAALSDNGKVLFWGTFRDANGIIGVETKGNILKKPKVLMDNLVIVKIVSGGDHLACLTLEGDIYTLGNAEQGQLGRIAEMFATRGGRKGIEPLLNPGLVRCKKRGLVFSDIWAGTYCTFAQAKDSGDIYVWGLNNYYQLGLPDMANRYVPQKIRSFGGKSWKSIYAGQHHTVALTSDGKVFTLGRQDYGRLGLGENCGEKKEPTQVTKLDGLKIESIAAGSATSFAVTDDGVAYSWGMGSTKQLGNGTEDDEVEPTKVIGKQMENKEVLMVSSGGQHTALLARERMTNGE